MNEQQHLIQKLINCTSKQEAREILRNNNNFDLVDVGFLRKLQQKVERLQQEGDIDKSDFLRDIVSQLVDFRGIEEEDLEFAECEPPQSPLQRENNESYNAESKKAVNRSNQVSGNDRRLTFLNEILQLIKENQGESHKIYPFLQTNVYLLNESFIQTINHWANKYLLQQSGEAALDSAGLILELGNLIDRFPLGDKAINLEIEITCYQASLRVVQRNRYPQQWAMTQNNLAAAYCDRLKGDKRNNIENAITCSNNALQVFTNIFSYEWAMTQDNLGNACIQRIKEDRAENIEKAIAAYNNALQVYTRNTFPYEWAKSQNNLATAYIQRIDGNKADNLEEAIGFINNALQVYTRETFSYEWAKVQDSLGKIYVNRIRGDKADNLKEAIAAYNNALQVYTHEALPYEWAGIQNDLATVYIERTKSYIDRIKRDKADNLEEAIDFIKNALQIYTRETFPYEWARSQNNLGLIYGNRIRGDKADNSKEAIAAYNNALQIYTRETFPYEWARSQINLGTSYVDRIKENRAENIEKAIAAYNNALQVFTCETFPSEWAATQHNLGHLYSEINGDQAENIEKAIAAYKNALQIYTPYDFPLECLQTSGVLSDLYFKEHNWQFVIEASNIAIQAVENLRSEAFYEFHRQKIMQEAITVYRNIVESYINLKQIDIAIEYAERSKTRDLVELLSNHNLYPKGKIPKADVTELDRLRKEIVTQEKQLAAQEISDNRAMLIAEERQQQYQPQIPDRSKLNQLKQQLEELISRNITHIDPTFSLTQKVEPITFDEIKTLTSENTAILQWYISNYKILTFIITDDSQQLIVKQVPFEDCQALTGEIENYLNIDFKNKQGWQNRIESILDNFAQYLHLDEIISSLPPECNSLILIPHGFIHLLPIHALKVTRKYEDTIIGTGYLLDLFPNQVSYVPSCQLLKLINNQKRDYSNNLFAIQNPTKDLPYTGIEVDAIRQLFKPNDKVLVKDYATKENLTQQNLNQTDCIHFSTHGYFNFQEPLKSALIFANSKTQKQENINYNTEKSTCSPQNEILDLEKCLTLVDIFNLDLRNCSLVTLSACETGLIDLGNVSDEYISLPSGFLFAGSANVVSSLWAVNDLSTAFLMIKFYQNHKQKALPIAKALNEAQKWLRDLTKIELQTWIEENKLPLSAADRMSLRRRLHKLTDDDRPFYEPYYWAAFCAIGQ